MVTMVCRNAPLLILKSGEAEEEQQEADERL